MKKFLILLIFCYCPHIVSMEPDKKRKLSALENVFSRQNKIRKAELPHPINCILGTRKEWDPIITYIYKACGFSDDIVKYIFSHAFPLYKNKSILQKHVMISPVQAYEGMPDYSATSTNINLLRNDSGKRYNSLSRDLQDIYLKINNQLAAETHLFCVAFNHDITYIATGSHDKMIRLWKNNGEAITLSKRLSAHTDSVCSIVFNQKSDQFVSGSNDRTLRFWQLDSDGNASCIRTVGHRFNMTSLAYSPDEDILEVKSEQENEKVHYNLKNWNNLNDLIHKDSFDPIDYVQLTVLAKYVERYPRQISYYKDENL